MMPLQLYTSSDPTTQADTLTYDLSARLQSVSSAAICQLGCGLSARLRYVSSAQLHVPAQLSYNVLAQVHFVSSAATCQLSCIL